MKNSLETYAAQNGLEEAELLNNLQENGIVSDLCLTLHDVCTSDCAKAVEVLKGELF